MRFAAIEGSTSQNQIHRTLLPDQGRQSRGRNWREAAQFDLRESPRGVFCGDYKVADHRQFGSPTQALPADLCHRNPVPGNDLFDHGVKLREHFRNVLRCVYRNIDAGGEGSIGAGEDDDRNFRLLSEFFESGGKFVHHLQVDDIQRRIRERDAGDWWAEGKRGAVELRIHARNWEEKWSPCPSDFDFGRFKQSLQIDCRLSRLSDGEERIARAFFLGNPMFFVSDQFEQEFLVFISRQYFAQVLFILFVAERLTGAGMELLSRKSTDRAIEFEIR